MKGIFYLPKSLYKFSVFFIASTYNFKLGKEKMRQHDRFHVHVQRKNTNISCDT